MRRILVFGVTGSGKTVAAARIAAATGIPWTSVDDLAWMPGWRPVEDAEQRRRISELCARDEWILDAAYGAWLDIPLGRVELVVGLDYPRLLSLQRLLRRTVARIVSRQPICNGNTESVRMAISRDSIIGWHFRSFARQRARMRAWREQTDGPRVLLFARPRQLDRWIASLVELADA